MRFALTRPPPPWPFRESDLAPQPTAQDLEGLPLVPPREGAASWTEQLAYATELVRVADMETRTAQNLDDVLVGIDRLDDGLQLAWNNAYALFTPSGNGVPRTAEVRYPFAIASPHR
jgi:hypothetical protein